MKKVTNNQVNSLLFVNVGNFLDATYVQFRQLGSLKKTLFNVQTVETDCFTARLGVTIGQDALHNGLYTLFVLDSTNKMIAETTVKVDGFTEDSPMAFINTDDADVDGNEIIRPPKVSFSMYDLTFSNDNNE